MAIKTDRKLYKVLIQGQTWRNNLISEEQATTVAMNTRIAGLGMAYVELQDGQERRVHPHWYEFPPARAGQMEIERMALSMNDEKGENEMEQYTIDRYEQGQWVWAGDGDTADGCTADLPDKVLAFADAGKTGEVQADGYTYRVSLV